MPLPIGNVFENGVLCSIQWCLYIFKICSTFSAIMCRNLKNDTSSRYLYGKISYYKLYFNKYFMKNAYPRLDFDSMNKFI